MKLSLWSVWKVRRSGLALSLRQNGDTEVFFGRQELEQLIEALQKAQAALPSVKPVV
jgi:hypothetical protein